MPQLQRQQSPYLTSARQWLLDSGIQSQNGGVSRYYKGDEGRMLPVSTEITGYFVSGMLAIGEIEAACHAGRFLTRQAWDRELRIFPFELEPGERLAYFFDSGIIARGLMALWRSTGEQEFLDAAVAAGDSMIRDFTADAGCHPILSLPAKRPVPYHRWWSRCPGAFHLKAALAWRQLAQITGDQRYEDSYQRMLAFALVSYRALIDDETEPVRVMDRLHAYCYFLEGLLPELDAHRDLFHASLAEIAGWRKRLAGEFERSDVAAQHLRLRILTGDESSLAPAEAEAVVHFQFASGDGRLDGAFAFGRRNGKLIPHANPVSTVFALQALDWHERAPANAGWRDLI